MRDKLNGEFRMKQNVTLFSDIEINIFDLFFVGSKRNWIRFFQEKAETSLQF